MLAIWCYSGFKFFSQFLNIFGRLDKIFMEAVWFKEAVHVISSDPSFLLGNILFTTIPLKALSVQEWMRFPLFLFKKLIISNHGTVALQQINVISLAHQYTFERTSWQADANSDVAAKHNFPAMNINYTSVVQLIAWKFTRLYETIWTFYMNE